MDCKCLYNLDVFGDDILLYRNDRVSNDIVKKDEDTQGLEEVIIKDGEIDLTDTFYCMVTMIYNDTKNVDEERLFYNLIEVKQPAIARKYFGYAAVILIIVLTCLFFIVLS
jgi:hypothetical protein